MHGQKRFIIFFDKIFQISLPVAFPRQFKNPL